MVLGMSVGALLRKRANAGAGVGTAPTAGDVVAYYKCEDNAANTTVVDATGTTNGTMNGANTEDVTTTGVLNNGFNLNGANQYFVTVTTTLQSISLWVDPDVTINSSSSINTLFGTESTFNMGVFTGTFTGLYANEVIAIVDSGTTNSWYWTSSQISSIPSGSFNHIVFVWESANSNYRLYVNKVDVGLANIEGSPVRTSETFTIGRFNNRFFGGTVDEVMFSDEEWNQSNVDYLNKDGSPGTEQQYPFT